MTDTRPEKPYDVFAERPPEIILSPLRIIIVVLIVVTLIGVALGVTEFLAR
jgi:hypothetical protein